MVTTERWYADDRSADVWEESTEDYLAELQAYNEEYQAELQEYQAELQEYYTALRARRALQFARWAEYAVEQGA